MPNLFTQDNTEGFTSQELEALNILWTYHCEAYGIEPDSIDYFKEAQWFSDRAEQTLERMEHA